MMNFQSPSSSSSSKKRKESLLNSLFQSAIKQKLNQIEHQVSPHVTLRRGSSSSASHKTPTQQSLIQRATSLCIQNTPTPILNQRHAQKTSDAEAIATTTTKRLIIPNTPCLPTNKKRLLNVNGGYFAADTMPGGDDAQGNEEENNAEEEETRGKYARRGVALHLARMTNAEAVVAGVNKKVAQIFKPKASLNSKDHQQQQGSDLSYGKYSKKSTY